MTHDATGPNITILGVGLLGGSVAKAIRRRHPSATITGFARSPDRANRLASMGMVDRCVSAVAEACAGADVVIVGTPVDRIAPLVVEAAEATGDAALITDVGSTKATIVSSVARHPVASGKFVAAHPIAGSEKSGAEYSTAELFDGKTIVLTPDASTDAEGLVRANQFWRDTGGCVIEMSPEEHDRRLAAVSHLPHLMSAMVARLAPAEAHALVGSGWRDITRVAAGDPTMWTAICSENRPAILTGLRQWCDELGRLRDLLESGDDTALRDWLAAAKSVKESVNDAGQSTTG